MEAQSSSPDAKPFLDRVEVFAIAEDGLLMSVRKPKGAKAFPGGTVEDGEKLENACSRETREETGFDIEEIRPFNVPPAEVDYPNPPRSEKERQRAETHRGTRTHFFLARLGERIEERPLDPEFVGSGVVSFDKAREACDVKSPLAGVRRAIIDVLSRLLPVKEASDAFQPDFEPEHLADIVATRHLDADPDWLHWYEGYRQGLRNDDDARQIKRWSAIKHRHGASFARNPTPRRGEALARWGIDPLQLLPENQRKAYAASVDAYRAHRDLLQRHRQEKAELLDKAAMPEERLKVAIDFRVISQAHPRYVCVPRRGAKRAMAFLREFGTETTCLTSGNNTEHVKAWLDSYKLAFDHVVNQYHDKSAQSLHVDCFISDEAYDPHYDARAIVHQEMLAHARKLEEVG